MDEVPTHRSAIRRLGERFGVRNIRVLGSVARGEAAPDSDLDLPVDVEQGHGYFDMAGFALGVEGEPSVMTQVATSGGLKLRIRDCAAGGRRPVRRDDERLADILEAPLAAGFGPVSQTGAQVGQSEQVGAGHKVAHQEPA